MGRKPYFIFPKISLLKSDEGFTLIELIVVIAILASLLVMTIVVLNPQTQFAKARDVQRKSDLNTITQALMMYKNDYHVYPPDNSGSIEACSGAETYTVVWGADAFKCGSMTYMKLLPEDPLGESAAYTYKRMDPDVYDFCLWATLENTTDPSITKFQQRCSQCTGLGSSDIVVCSD